MDKKTYIKKKIREKELQISKLHLHQTTSEVCSKLLNSLILEKAILKKELQELDKNLFVEAIKNIIPKKEKLISDYFNS